MDLASALGAHGQQDGQQQPMGYQRPLNATPAWRANMGGMGGGGGYASPLGARPTGLMALGTAALGG
jgi:hypothetical protein